MSSARATIERPALDELLGGLRPGVASASPRAPHEAGVVAGRPAVDQRQAPA